jgi:hypothetical protein
MPDVYGNDIQVGDSWQLDGAVLEIEDGAQLVVTSAVINYVRNVIKYSPLNSKKRYMVTGEADGTLQLGAIIGPSKDIKVFLERYARACNVKKNTITIKPAGIETCDDDSDDPVSFVCRGLLLSALNVSVQQVGSSMTVVNAGMSMNFLSLAVN